ncbi:protein tyrosine kinase [Teladorsagia circumcincta]|uniref:Protein tyrosine kinase n=1 Tax=Teladorsagia circumcincta TaxID=45464 RepID=A0A2G9U698_TELCI|nr:protein tyrosine kinase [Teladorsagia circumcincta]
MDTKIGEGQFGEVWKGHLKTKKGDKVESTIVAVKVMKVNTSTQHQLEMFHQEARLMRMYDHRNVVKLHGMVYSEDNVMVVMELVSGGGLNTYLKQKKLMPLIKASFCYDIAAGLAYLHSKNCMHRDVAARNCLVTTDGRMIKLSDFGLAAHGSRLKLPSTERVPIRWQAPEVLFYHVYLRESDVWSYGMLMSEIYNDGKVPFHDKSVAEIRAKSITVGSRIGHKPPIKHIIVATTKAVVNHQKVPPKIVDEVEAGRAVGSQQLKPFVPAVRTANTPSESLKTAHGEGDRPRQAQSTNIAAQPRHTQHGKQDEKKDALQH